MPVLDGWAFIQACRELTQDDIPIVGVSACMTGEVATHLRELGVRACLAKPFDLDEARDRRCDHMPRLASQPLLVGSSGLSDSGANHFLNSSRPGRGSD